MNLEGDCIGDAIFEFEEVDYWIWEEVSYRVLGLRLE